MIVSTPCNSHPHCHISKHYSNSTMTILQTSHNYIFTVLRSTSMNHAKQTIFTKFRCTRRVVLTFSHFITETGKQISTYHQGSAVHNDSKSIFLLFLQGTQWFREISLQDSSSSLHIHDVREQFGDNLTVTTCDISKLTLNTSVSVAILSGVPEGTIARISAIRLKAGWRSLLKKSKDGHVLNLLFSSEYIISYLATVHWLST